MDGTTAGSLGSVFPVQPKTAPADGGLLSPAYTPPAPVIPSFPQSSPTAAPIQNPVPPVQNLASLAGSTDYAEIENNIQDFDFDQMAYAEHPVSATTEPITPTPPAPTVVSNPVIPAPTVTLPPPPPAPVAIPMPITAPVPVPTAMPVSEPMSSLPPIGIAPTPAAPAELEPISFTPIAPIPPAPEPILTVVPKLPEPVTIAAPVVVPEPVVEASAPIVVPEPKLEPIVKPEPALAAQPAATKSYFGGETPIPADVSIGSSKSRSSINPLLLRRIVIIAGIIIVLGVGGFFAVHAITGAHKSQTTSTAKTPSTTTVTQPDFTQTTSDTTTPSDTTTTTPSDTTTTPADGTATAPTTPSNVPSVANTAVSDDFASLPGFLDITKLGIHAPVEQVSTTSTGAMGTPNSIWNAGWYTGSSKPGQTGVTFMDGHSSSAGGALFGKLDTLAVGDTIKVERNDGINISYTVAKVSVVNRNDVNMASMLKPYNVWKNGLNLMSCEGAWVSSENTLENRVLVYAVQT